MQPLIHLVDDDAAFQAAMGRLLRQAGHHVVSYTSANDLLNRLPSSDCPGCILLDVRIPGMTGPELQDVLGQRGLGLPIIFITGYGDIPTTVRAIKAGAEDFLSKPVSRDQLLAAIDQALSGQRSRRDKMDRIDELHRLVRQLTPRQHQVFELVVRGKLNKQIGFEIGTSERTVKAHRQQVMEKLKVDNLAELVSLAQTAGLLSEDQPQQ